LMMRKVRITRFGQRQRLPAFNCLIVLFFVI
jgi:hypothetical protein